LGDSARDCNRNQAVAIIKHPPISIFRVDRKRLYTRDLKGSPISNDL
jgi:hypothetical protein